MNRLIIHTSVVWNARNCINPLDVTVKSGDRVFAPTWPMVMGYKNGTLSEAQYTADYVSLMTSSYRENKERWLEVLNMGEVTLLCYCKPGAFCHRTILAQLLEATGPSLGIEVVNEGEL